MNRNYYKYDNIWIAGGASVFNEAMNHPKLEKIYTTEIDTDMMCSHFISEIPSNFSIISNTEWMKENTISYRHTIYERAKGDDDFIPKNE